MKENRIYYFDIIKCIASYLICLSHFGTLNTNIVHSPDFYVYFNYFLQGVSSVGVPIFLMVNGAFLLNKNYPLSKIYYRVRAYLLLFLVWGTISLLILAPLFQDHYNLGQFLSAVLRTKAGRTEHLWFLMAMTYIYLLFPFLKVVYDKSEKAYTTYMVVVLFVCTFGFVFLNEVAKAAGFFLHSSTLSQMDIKYLLWFNPFDKWFAYTILYFICGGLVAKNIAFFNQRAGTLVFYILMSLVLLFVFGLMKTHFDTIEYDSVWGGHNSIMTLVMAIALFVLCSRIKIKNEKFIKVSKVIGLNTLGIYFIHVPLGFWLTDYYKKLPISNYLLADLFYALVLMMASLCISIFLKKIPGVNRLVRI